VIERLDLWVVEQHLGVGLRPQPDAAATTRSWRAAFGL
jgi:hypothetical protein